MNDLHSVSEHRLRATGVRITPQRKLILDILAKASGCPEAGHLSADDIYARALRQDTHISLSTVYRTLALLKETGLVTELHLDDEHHHYELDVRDGHSHLVCEGCGRVIEVDSAAFSTVAMAAGQAYDFEVTGTQVELTGICAQCRVSVAGPPR